MTDPDDIPGAPKPEIEVDRGLLKHVGLVAVLLMCVVTAHTFVWLKLQARATGNAIAWLEVERRQPADQQLATDANRRAIAEKVVGEFPLSDDQRKMITGMDWTPSPPAITAALCLLALTALNRYLRKTPMKQAWIGPATGAAVGCATATIGAVSTFGPWLL